MLRNSSKMKRRHCKTVTSLAWNALRLCLRSWTLTKTLAPTLLRIAAKSSMNCSTIPARCKKNKSESSRRKSNKSGKSSDHIQQTLHSTKYILISSRSHVTGRSRANLRNTCQLSKHCTEQALQRSLSSTNSDATMYWHQQILLVQ